jgi:hypothetical protein
MKTSLQLLLLPAIALMPTAVQRFATQENCKSNFNTTNIYNYKTPDDALPSLSEVDAAADVYIPTNRIYTYNEAIAIRKSLQSQVEANPTSLSLNWALLRFYTCAPNFVGGNMNQALQFAGYLYNLNSYIGSLAYEYVYSRHKQAEKAETWYKRSTQLPLPKNMVWQDISYNNSVVFGIKVSGNFNNWKQQSMYENSYGVYTRRIMTPKCDNCQYKLIVDYKDQASPTKSEMVVRGF